MQKLLSQRITKMSDVVETEGRFTVGKKELFVNVWFTRDVRNYPSLYLPWQDLLDWVEVLELTCVAHHKVPTDYSDELRCDGYIFEDAAKNSWYNQYPKASYGQIDDSNDGYVRKTGDTKSYMKPHTKAERFMDNILRGVHDFQGHSKNLPNDDIDAIGSLEKAYSLAIFFAQVREQIEKLGYGVEIAPVSFTNGEGVVTVIPSMLETIITKNK